MWPAGEVGGGLGEIAEGDEERSMHSLNHTANSNSAI